MNKNYYTKKVDRIKQIYKQYLIKLSELNKKHNQIIVEFAKKLEEEKIKNIREKLK